MPMKSTDLKYLQDTYADTDTATVLRSGRDERGSYIVFDQTIFYPQGGGQPSDTGSIICGQHQLDVSFVGFQDGEVLHYLAEEPSDFDALSGCLCELQVDQARRLEHAKLHTGGHLIAAIIDAQRGPMRAVKGFHFNNGPYVEFEGKPEGDTAVLLADLQAQIDAMIAENAAVTAEMVTYDELQQRCWSVPSYLPQDKPLRVVTVGDMDAVPCGGTHLSGLAELEAISVLKMKSKKGNTKISYRLGAVA